MSEYMAGVAAYSLIAVFLAISLAFGFWASSLARKNRRSQNFWFIMGVLTWIVAVLLLYLMPVAGSHERRRRRRQRRPRSTKICWRCHGILPIDAPYCPSCGAESSSEQDLAQVYQVTAYIDHN